MKAYLLHRDRDFDFGAELPSNHEHLIQDLELTTLLQAMACGDRFLLEVSKRVLLGSLLDPAEILYRQNVLADCIAEPEIVRSMYAIAVRALEDKRRIWGFGSRNPRSILSSAVSQLDAAVVRLRELRKLADDHAEKFRSDGLRALFSTLQCELDDEYFQTISYHLDQLRFREGQLISAELDRDNSGINFVLRSASNSKSSWRARLGIGPRSSYSFTIPPRDEAGDQILADLTNRGINLVANAAAQSADHIGSYLSMLQAELGFYVSCLNLHDRLEIKGEPTSFPEASQLQSGKLTFTELCDICLALRTETRVVGNDVDADGTSMVVITGANSGGKSTFLRSVGLAQLMMQSSMFVTAAGYQASVCDGIFTHFIREEDTRMTSGRLDEELRRMSTIADQVRRYSLVLFNESFAATNEREGSEIARQIVYALLDAEIKVCFVTHQFDFSHSFHRRHSSSTLFLRAGRELNGRRSYKLVVAEPLPTSFGEDLYHRLGGWMDEDLSRRVS